MNKAVLMGVLIPVFLAGSAVYSLSPDRPAPFQITLPLQDTIRYKQMLYNGILWKNKYRRIEGDQFLFSNIFLPGSVTINGHTFSGIKLKYDIFTDEIITPLDLQDIVQLNKEMVDSFTLSLDNRIYRFIKLPDDTLRVLNGYVNVIYSGSSSLYVKNVKLIRPLVTDVSDGEFYQLQRIYMVNNTSYYPIAGLKDLLKVMGEDKVGVKNYISKNKLRISKKTPESFIPVLKYYDTISH